jgi:hypothetical protein
VGLELELYLSARRFLPTAAQIFVEGDNYQHFVALRSGEVQLCWEKLLLRLQHLVMVGLSCQITLGREFDRRFQRCDFGCLLVANFRQALARNQRVRNIAKRKEN